MSQGAGDNSSGIGKHRLIAIIFLLITLLMVSRIIPFYGTSVPYTSQFSTGHGSSATGHTSTGQTPSVVNPSSPAILPAIIAQARSTTGFDNSWLISQAGYRGTSIGTLTGNVFHARIYNVISNVTGAFGPWGYSVIQKGLLDWGPA